MIEKALSDLTTIIKRLEAFRADLRDLRLPRAVIVHPAKRRPKLQRFPPTIRPSKIRRAINTAIRGHKTARMMAVLADGKRHSAKELALVGGVTRGHVPTHLGGRMKRREVRRVAPGVYQLAAKKKAA